VHALGLDLDLREPAAVALLRAGDFRRAFEADSETMRQALRALLGEGRIAVREDAERGFVAEGWISLPLGVQPPGVAQAPPGRLERVVAGDRYTPVALICRSRSQPSPGRSAGSPSAAVPAA
jgi:hypothetical protein